MKHLKMTKLAFLIAALSGGAVVHAADTSLSQEKHSSGTYNASADQSSVIPNQRDAHSANEHAMEGGSETDLSATVSDAANEVEQDAEELTDTAGDKMRQGANEVEQEASELSSDVRQGANELGRETRQEANELSSETRQGANELSSDAREEANELTSGAQDRMGADATVDANQSNSSEHMVHFEFDSAELSADAESKLETLVQDMQGKAEDVTLVVSGYTDAVGPESYNEDLAERRAETVKEYLKESELEVSNINVEARGEANPISSNESQSGREENRRVEISAEDEEIGSLTSE